MYIVDSHCDSIQKVDSRKQPLVNPYNYSARYRQLQFVAIFCCWPKEDGEASFKRAARYLGQFNLSCAAEAERVSAVRTYADIEAAFAAGKHAALLTMEGGTGILASEKILADYYAAGVRVFGLAWASNDLAESNRLTDGVDNGLSEAGRRIVEAGNRLGMIFDVSHLSDRSFFELDELSAKPIVATHSNCRALCPHTRNLTDEQIRVIIARGGMIGLNLCPGFVDEDPARRTVDRLLDHLDHIIDLGGAANVGFGGDIDGTSGQYPAPLDESGSIHDRIIDAMVARGYDDATIEAVAGGNWLRYLRAYL